MDRSEVKEFSGAGEYNIHQSREEILGEFGPPKFDVPLIFGDQIFIFDYSHLGFAYWFSTQNPKYPFMIELSKKVAGEFKRIDFFGMTAKSVIIDYLIPNELTFFSYPQGKINVQELACSLSFNKDTLKDDSTIKTICIYRQGWLYHLDNLNNPPGKSSTRYSLEKATKMKNKYTKTAS
jgi:hypothetical protein